MEFDYIIVGAGFAGSVLAERLASQNGKKCLVVDRRNHIGGNAYDSYSSAGVLMHNYGPHYFRTNSEKIKSYLSNFTEWHKVEYKILVWTDGKYWQFPINLNTFEQLLGRPSTTEEMQMTLDQWKVPVKCANNSEEIITSQVGTLLYEKFYKNYSRKQWGCDPKELSPSVCGRIPIRLDRDDRYLSEQFQALPKHGYHKLFECMLKHQNITVLLNTDYRSIISVLKCKHLIFTGPIDEYYGYCFGRLPYRSLHFESENIDAEYFQPAVQVNYPNNFDYTRIVEIKHATGQKIPVTTIVREFPKTHDSRSDPYYPIPNPTNHQLYQKYKTRADCERGVSFVGRLATYRYYNMDQIVGMALAEWQILENGSNTET